MKKKDEGFTLIELLIVIVILGILATVVVFAVSGIRDKGDQSACETEFRAIQTSVEAYYADNGAYPADVTALGSYFNSPLTYFTDETVDPDSGEIDGQDNGADACDALLNP